MKYEVQGNKIAEEGSHRACVIGIYDIGTVTGSWQGEETKQKKVIVEFETDEGAKISNFYNFFISEGSQLGILMKSLTQKPLVLGESGDFEELLGKCCIIKVGLNSNNKPKIEDSMPLLKGDKGFDPKSDMNFYDMEISGDCDFCPAFAQKYIKQAPEYKGKM